MNPAQLSLAHARVSLIEQALLIAIRRAGTHRRPAITDKMLGARQDRRRTAEIIPLKTSDRGGAETFGELRRFAKPFISPAPAFVREERQCMEQNSS